MCTPHPPTHRFEFVKVGETLNVASNLKAGILLANPGLQAVEQLHMRSLHHLEEVLARSDAGNVDRHCHVEL